MKLVDLSNEPKIPAYMDMALALSRAKSPRDVLRAFIAAMARVHGRRGRMVLATAGLEPGQYRASPLMRIADAAYQNKRVSAVTRTADNVQAQWFFGVNEAVVPVRQGGMFGEIVAAQKPVLIHRLELDGADLIDPAMANFHSMLAVPMYFTGAADYWFCMFDEHPEGLSSREVAETILRGNLIGTTISNLGHAEQLRSANAWIGREVDQIAQLQHDFLPQSLPTIPGLDIAAHYETFERAGGDYYDFIPLRRMKGGKGYDANGPWLLLIADAAGHGPAAAVLTAMLHTVLNGVFGVPRTVPDIVDFVNSRMMGRRLRYNMVTAFCGIYWPEERAFAYCRAGHPAPLVRRADGAVRLLDDVNGFPLGIDAEADWPEGEIHLEPGDRLVLYTDGVTDAIADSGERWGDRRLVESVAASHGSAAETVAAMVAAFKGFQSKKKTQDDQTVVVFRVADE